MRRHAAIAISLILAGCATPRAQTEWHKAGASHAEFSQDRYSCLQQSQQRASTASVGAYGGSSSSQIVTNDQLYGSCMNAKGWFLRNQVASGQPSASKTNPLKQEVDSLNREIRESCSREDLQPVFLKSPCEISTATLEQLSDKSTITDAQKSALLKVRLDQQSRNRRFATAFRRYGGENGSAMAMLYERGEVALEQHALALYESRISWGAYTQRRKELTAGLREDAGRITQQK
jgi:hypothetical protein